MNNRTRTRILGLWLLAAIILNLALILQAYGQSTGTLVVRVVNDGTAPASDWSLAGPSGTYTVAGTGGINVWSVSAGNHTQSITSKTNYNTVVACTTGATGTTSVVAAVTAGATTVCTFTNRRTVAVFTVILDTVPDHSTNAVASWLSGGYYYMDDVTPSDGDAYENTEILTTCRAGQAWQSCGDGIAALNNWTWNSTPSGYFFKNPAECTEPLLSATPLFSVRPYVAFYSAGGHDATCTFTMEKGASLTVHKYREQNGTPGKNGAETTVYSAWTIRVYETDGTTVVATASTNALGNASFTLAPRSYLICETLKTGYLQKWPNPADSTPANGDACWAYTFTPGEVVTLQFGNCPTASCPTMSY